MAFNLNELYADKKSTFGLDELKVDKSVFNLDELYKPEEITPEVPE